MSVDGKINTQNLLAHITKTLNEPFDEVEDMLIEGFGDPGRGTLPDFLAYESSFDDRVRMLLGCG